jgi:EAL domain-containing protein (putative c-di-GMP-specific phosphodiesterase class I)/GGDEF domain-containing protein
MSLFRHIWLTIIGLTLAALIGSLLVNTLTARSYLEKQLFIKNKDNATALALSMSQQSEKDQVTMELLLSALFDNGHYQAIVLTDPAGNVMVERTAASDTDLGAPAWFVRLLPIRVAPGVAHITDGWKQYGSISLASHSKFAYRDLWLATLELIGWFLAGGIVAGVIATLLLRLITRPLDQVVSQAKAITERRFISVPEPRVPELKSVVSAMNDMVARVKQMFSEEAARLDTLSRKHNYDAISGLPSRDYFMTQMCEALESDESAPYGTFLLMRLKDLGEIHRQIGRSETDKLVHTIGNTLEQLCDTHNHWVPARLNGPDFALLAPNQHTVSELAGQLAEKMTLLRQERYPHIEELFYIGAMCYRRGDAISQLLAGCDQLVAKAEARGGNSVVVHGGDASEIAATPAETWRELISTALMANRVKLVNFPVVNADCTALLHREGVIRLQTEVDGPWHPAGDFMPFAVRLKLTTYIDLSVVNLALDFLRKESGNFAINLSAETCADRDFRKKFIGQLKEQGEVCKRLWVEVPESAAVSHFDAFHELCRALKALGCKVGIESFGRKFTAIDKFADLGVDYVKVDSSFVHGIDQNDGNREFLKGLCKMVHSIGIMVIAVGVQNQQELDILVTLGCDGITGPTVREPG